MYTRDCADNMQFHCLTGRLGEEKKLQKIIFADEVENSIDISESLRKNSSTITVIMSDKKDIENSFKLSYSSTILEKKWEELNFDSSQLCNEIIQVIQKIFTLL